jgi:hypothetical protein
LSVWQSADNFFTDLQAKRREHGSSGVWSKYLESVNEFKLSYSNITWENDQLIFLQIFCGEQEAGHWALLVVDRTVDKLGTLVFIASLPKLFSDTFDKLKQALVGMPLAPEGSKWIRATMPCQGKFTMTVEYSWCAWPHFTQKGSSVVVVS